MNRKRQLSANYVFYNTSKKVRKQLATADLQNKICHTEIGRTGILS